jgi:hypothetical protein
MRLMEPITGNEFDVKIVAHELLGLLLKCENTGKIMPLEGSILGPYHLFRIVEINTQERKQLEDAGYTFSSGNIPGAKRRPRSVSNAALVPQQPTSCDIQQAPRRVMQDKEQRCCIYSVYTNLLHQPLGLSKCLYICYTNEMHVYTLLYGLPSHVTGYGRGRI